MEKVSMVQSFNDNVCIPLVQEVWRSFPRLTQWCNWFTTATTSAQVQHIRLPRAGAMPKWWGMPFRYRSFLA